MIKETEKEARSEKMCKAITRAMVKSGEEEWISNKSHCRAHIGLASEGATPTEKYEIIFSMINLNDKRAMQEFTKEGQIDEIVAKKTFIENEGGHWVTRINKNKLNDVDRIVEEILSKGKEKEYRSVGVNVISALHDGDDLLNLSSHLLNECRE